MLKVVKLAKSCRTVAERLVAMPTLKEGAHSKARFRRAILRASNGIRIWSTQIMKLDLEFNGSI